MSALTEQQKARIVELARIAEFEMRCYARGHGGIRSRWKYQDASAEAFRIAQEARR